MELSFPPTSSLASHLDRLSNSHRSCIPSTDHVLSAWPNVVERLWRLSQESVVPLPDMVVSFGSTSLSPVCRLRHVSTSCVAGNSPWRDVLEQGHLRMGRKVSMFEMSGSPWGIQHRTCGLFLEDVWWAEPVPGLAQVKAASWGCLCR